MKKERKMKEKDLGCDFWDHIYGMTHHASLAGASLQSFTFSSG
jgi:hypothetical protein